MTDAVEIGPFLIVGATQEKIDFLKARERFSKSYCESKGWSTNPADLTIEQILEVREQDGWKNPLGSLE